MTSQSFHFCRKQSFPKMRDARVLLRQNPCWVFAFSFGTYLPKMSAQLLVWYNGPKTRSLGTGLQVAVDEKVWKKRNTLFSQKVPVEYSFCGRRRTLEVDRDHLTHRGGAKKFRTRRFTEPHVPLLPVYQYSDVNEVLIQPIAILHYDHQSARNSKWYPYDTEDSNVVWEIQSNFRTHKQQFNCACVAPKVHLSTYEVDLATMTQKNRHTGSLRNVRFIPVPMPKTNTTSILLDPDFALRPRDVYLDSAMSFKPLQLADLIHSKFRDPHQLSVWQVGGTLGSVPKALFYAHVDLLEKMEQKCDFYFGFHGSNSLDKVDSIFRQGFRGCMNRSAAYGPGTYFAADCAYSYAGSYSAESDLPNAQALNIRRIILALLAVPRVTTSRRLEALENGVTAVNVDNVANPQIFSVAQDSLALPLLWIDVSMKRLSEVD